MEDALRVLEGGYSQTGLYLRMRVCERMGAGMAGLDEFARMTAERAAMWIAYECVRQREEARQGHG